MAMNEKKTYHRGFVRPGVYATKEGIEIEIPDSWAKFPPEQALMVLDDIENRYGFLNTSDLKKTLYERLGVSGQFERPEDRPPVMREILRTLQLILKNLEESGFYDEEEAEAT